MSETEKSDNSALTKSTLFVSSIPFDATKEELEEFYSQIGPIRSCFIIMKEGKSTGCGFVQFALQEDAEKAMKDLKKTKFKDQRTLRMSIALKKVEVEARKEGSKLLKAAGVPLKEKVMKKIKKPIKVVQVAKPVEKKLPSETVLLSNLPPVDKKVLYKKVKKYGQVESIVLPDSDSGLSEGQAKIIYASKVDAQRAVRKLDDHIFKGVKITCKFIHTITDGALQKQARLIVRNLSFDCQKKHLLKVFEPFGKIVDCTIPLKPDGLGKGFGFVQFATVKDAGKAIEGMNGQTIMKRPVAVDWALNKTLYEQMLQEEKDESEEDNEDEATEEKEENDPEQEQGEGDEPIIVQDAESDKKARAAERRAKIDEEIKNCTLFIRNLSFETTNESLHDCFAKWGPLRYAVITKDKVTGLPKGNGFVCFKNLDDAEECLEEFAKSEDLIHSTTALPTPAEGDSILKPSIPEAVAEESEKFTLDGRLVSVTRIVSKHDAELINQSASRSRRASDKRNTYLLREGHIFPGSDAASSLTPEELERRQVQYQERKKALKTNPNLFVSKTRLSVRGIPLSVEDGDLKKESKEAIKLFWQQVEEGLRETLEQEVFDEEKEQGNKEPGPSRKVVIKQCKIVKDLDKLDKKTQKPKSRGYGFIEFSSHADALACLRYMNNNPAVFSSHHNGKRTLIVEFAIENRLALKKRDDRNARAAAKRKSADEGEPEAKRQKTDSKEKKSSKKDKKSEKMESSEIETQPDASKKSKEKVKSPKEKKPKEKKTKSEGKGKRESPSKVSKKSKPAKDQKPKNLIDKIASEVPEYQERKQKKVDKEQKFNTLVDSYKSMIKQASSDVTRPKSKWYE